MSCKEFVELVTDYFEGALSDEDVLRFEAHLDHCPWCTRYVDQMRVTIRTVGRIDEGSISDEARDVLLDEFRNWHSA